MSFWQLSAMVAGFNKANGADDDKTRPLNETDADRLAAYIDEPVIWN